MSGEHQAEELLRLLAPQVLGTLVRRHQSFDLCEDAVQEALVDAWTQWPARGVPQAPRAWLTTVATRRLVDQVRRDTSRRSREQQVVLGSPPAEFLTAASDYAHQSDRDDSLVLLLLCCHPALTPTSQIALTLRAVGGLTTAEIATAFFVSEATMAQRISRAKQTIRDAGATFTMPAPDELESRLSAVMHTLYLIFTEGHNATSGEQITRTDLTREAIRLTRELLRTRPDDPETKGLLALMLLTEARRPARTDSEGRLVPLADQDRDLWDADLISEGTRLVTDALHQEGLGPYQLQAAIAAVHDEASSSEDTDWAEILLLYQMLDRVAPNPMATLNRTLALAMVHGPDAGLALLDTLDHDERLAAHHRLHAMRGHLLEMASRHAEASEEFAKAAQMTTSTAEKRYLEQRAQIGRWAT